MSSKSNKKCSLVLIRNGKRLTGTAAQLAHTSESGGWDALMAKVAEQVVDDFAQRYNEAVRAEGASSTALRVVGGNGHKGGRNHG